MRFLPNSSSVYCWVKVELTRFCSYDYELVGQMQSNGTSNVPMEQQQIYLTHQEQMLMRQQQLHTQMTRPMQFYRQPQIMYSQNIQFQQNQMRISYPLSVNMIQTSNINQQMFQQQFSVANTMPIPVSQDYNRPPNQNNNQSTYPNRQPPAVNRNAPTTNLKSTNTTSVSLKKPLQSKNSMNILIQRANQVTENSKRCLSSSSLTPLAYRSLTLQLHPNTTTSNSTSCTQQPPILNESMSLDRTFLSNHDIAQTIEVTTTSPALQVPSISLSTNNLGHIGPVDHRSTYVFADEPPNAQMLDSNHFKLNATIDLNSSINDLPLNSSVSNVATLGSKPISPSTSKASKSKDTDSVAQLNKTLKTSKSYGLSKIQTVRPASIRDIQDMDNEELSSSNRSIIQEGPSLSESSALRSSIETKSEIDALTISRLYIDQNSRDVSLGPRESFMSGSALNHTIASNNARSSISCSEHPSLTTNSLNGTYWRNNPRETAIDADFSSSDKPYACCFTDCHQRFGRYSPRNIHEICEHKLERYEEDKKLEGAPKNQPRVVVNESENVSKNPRRRIHSSAEAEDVDILQKRIKQELVEQSRPCTANSTVDQTVSESRPLSQGAATQNGALHEVTPRRDAHSRRSSAVSTPRSAPNILQSDMPAIVDSLGPMSFNGETSRSTMDVTSGNQSALKPCVYRGSPEAVLKMYSLLVNQPPVIYYDYQMLNHCYGTSVINFWLAASNCHLLLVRAKTSTLSDAVDIDEPMLTSSMYRYDLPRTEDRNSYLLVYIKEHAGKLATKFTKNYNCYLPFKNMAEGVLPALDVDVLIIASDSDRKSIPNLEEMSARIRVVS
ncbi:hypothetical protein M3Y96_00924500 [Aphelenchoides besseyi]|nr:hypothetical protein M3Y96_00924500 [Aphelenchoides besseyi]